MADLDPLIRLRKHALDEKRRVIADLYRQAEEVEQRKQALLDEVETEKQAAEEMASLEASAYLGRYIEGARKKIAAYDQEIRKIETRIMIAQEDMRNAFADMKKIEITQRNRKDREKAEGRRKETKELDEIALETHRRNRTDGE